LYTQETSKVGLYPSKKYNRMTRMIRIKKNAEKIPHPDHPGHPVIFF
jgi:hypothetical protein